MNTITYEFCPGDKVFGVNFYPIGAKIFEGTVIEAVSKVSANSKFVGYKISSRPIVYFPEENVFGTEDEAKQAKENWLKQIKDKQTT